MVATTLQRLYRIRCCPPSATRHRRPLACGACMSGETAVGWRLVLAAWQAQTLCILQLCHNALWPIDPRHRLSVIHTVRQLGRIYIQSVTQQQLPASRREHATQ